MTEDSGDGDAVRLSGLSASRTIVMPNARRARLIRLLRLFLPIAALGIVALVLALPRMDQIKPVAQPAGARRTASTNELVNPHYEGTDASGQPYTATAIKAVQSAGNPDILLLDQPRGHAISGGRALDGRADKGTYHQQERLLYLEDNVQAHDAYGNHMEGSRLSVDLDNHRASTDMPVRGDGPDASIAASGLQADMATGTLIFTGPATLTLKHALKGF